MNTVTNTSEERLLHVSASAHIRVTTTTADIMKDVIISMLPACLFGIYQFGISALIIILATVISCVLTEYAFQKFLKKPITIKDLSAVVTGIILALNMPPQIPVWIPVLGGIFAILVVKQMYGGIGFNWMNPALAARCFLLISFAGKMTNFSSTKMGFDSVSSATPLASMKSYLTALHSPNAEAVKPTYKLIDLFLGKIPGTIGEVSAVALLIGVVYLLIRKTISLRIPIAYILTVAIFSFIFGIHSLDFVLYQVLGGGLIFGAFYMATDYTTTPITPKGQIIFGICIGILTGIFRLFGGSAEGVSYAIILGNILTPLIEKATIPVAFGKEKKHEKA